MKIKFKIGDEVMLNPEPQPDYEGNIDPYDETELLFIGIKGIILDEDIFPDVQFIHDNVLYVDDNSVGNKLVCNQWDLIPWKESYDIKSINENLDKLAKKYVENR